ncbi:MAG: ATP-binding cassette domain-containing protein, partial [Pseudomonadota bacterium]
GGKTTAIVGTTGSGKTTILSLLARLYDPWSGQVKAGDIPIQDITLHSLRSAFSMVAQDIVIFNASIRENIRYARPDATDAEVNDAAAQAEIASLMQDRGDALVGPKGAQLSGGQKQRIGIARAFLRNAPIVFLDEATSALDQQTEDKVQVALKRLYQGRTTIVVAHRLSTVMDADHIYVLENGQLVEQGSHNDLITAKGLYHTLFETQRNNFNTST